MGLFRSRATEVPADVPAAAAIPDYGFNQGSVATPKSSTGGSRYAQEFEKVTSYPAEMGGRAKFSARERTTSYQQASVYNRRTYDTIN